MRRLYVRGPWCVLRGPDGGSDLFRSPAAHAEITDAGVSVRLAEFLHRRLHDKRVMQKRARLLAPEQPREADLPAGRRKQILPANHQIDSMPEIIDADGELVGP